jgi:hypothetical protein
MQLNWLKILLMMLVMLFYGFTCANGQSERNRQTMSVAKAYRLLASGDRYGQSKWYAISVQTVPSADAVKALVCEVLRQEKPANYRIFDISIFLGLDSYVPPVGHGNTEVDRKQDELWVANYTWNADLPDRRDRIHLVREHRFVDFDHTRDCKE